MSLFGVVSNITLFVSMLGGGILLALYTLQDKLLYCPGFPIGSRTNFLRPERYLVRNWEENYIKTVDGEVLQIWLCKQTGDYTKVPTILYLHGNAGSKYKLHSYKVCILFSADISHRLPIAARLLDKVGVNVLLLSYRGYGKSTGYPSEVGLSHDAQAALDYLIARKDISSDKLICFGTSLGAAVAIDLAHRNPNTFKGVIIENTFTSIPDIVDVLFPPLKYFKFLSKNHFYSIEKIKEVSGDSEYLFISGRRDELIPKEMVSELYENCSTKNKRLHIYDGSHNDTWLCPNYFEDIYQWIKAIIKDHGNFELNDILKEFGITQ